MLTHESLLVQILIISYQINNIITKKSNSYVQIPSIKLSGKSLLCSISLKRYSHSAVKSGEQSCSGNTVISAIASCDCIS